MSRAAWTGLILVSTYTTNEGRPIRHGQYLFFENIFKAGPAL